MRHVKKTCRTILSFCPSGVWPFIRVWHFQFGADCERSIIYTNDMWILFSYAIKEYKRNWYHVFLEAGVHKKKGTLAMSIWVMSYDT